jgi:hypothetical protein
MSLTVMRSNANASIQGSMQAVQQREWSEKTTQSDLRYLKALLESAGVECVICRPYDETKMLAGADDYKKVRDAVDMDGDIRPGATMVTRSADDATKTTTRVEDTMHLRKKFYRHAHRKGKAMVLASISPADSRLVREISRCENTSDMIEALRKRHGAFLESRVTELERQLYTSRHEKGSSTWEYVTDFQDRCFEAQDLGSELKEADAVKIMLGGISVFQEVRTHLRTKYRGQAKDGLTFSETRALYKEAEDEERSAVGSGQRLQRSVGTAQVTTEPASSSELMEELRSLRAAMDQLRSAPRPFSGKCFNCGKPGHKKNECRQPRREQGGAEGAAHAS